MSDIKDSCCSDLSFACLVIHQTLSTWWCQKVWNNVIGKLSVTCMSRSFKVSTSCSDVKRMYYKYALWKWLLLGDGSLYMFTLSLWSACSVMFDSFVTAWTIACQAPLVHGISQGRILEWVTIFFSRGSSRPRDQTHVSWLAGWFFTTEPPEKPHAYFTLPDFIPWCFGLD